jgi:hypothetical protein
VDPAVAMRHLQVAKELMVTCMEMYRVTATGLAPEIAFFSFDETTLADNVQGEEMVWEEEGTEKRRMRKGHDGTPLLAGVGEDITIKKADAHNLLRPEVHPMVIYLTITYPITTCPIITCPIITCPITICPITTCPIITCPIITCPIITCPIIAYEPPLQR